MITYTVELLLSGNNTLKVDVKADCKSQACAIATRQFRGTNQVAYVTDIKEKYKLVKVISLGIIICALTLPVLG